MVYILFFLFSPSTVAFRVVCANFAHTSSLFSFIMCSKIAQIQFWNRLTPYLVLLLYKYYSCDEALLFKKFSRITIIIIVKTIFFANTFNGWHY